MKEKKNDFVHITDISYEALEKIKFSKKRFMYSAEVDNLDHDLIEGVIDALEKYKVNDLKKVCEQFLLKNLNISNAIKTLKLCKMYDLTDLKSYVEKFV